MHSHNMLYTYYIAQPHDDWMLSILPENCWIEHYFAPQAKAEEIFRRKHAGSRIVEELITSNHHEAELYSKYKAYYGYAFFIAKKIHPFQS